ncbi:Transient Receptor Potential Cation Channel Subfamily V Member 5, partial [Manis pentadactyla]
LKDQRQPSEKKRAGTKSRSGSSSPPLMQLSRLCQRKEQDDREVGLTFTED